MRKISASDIGILEGASYTGSEWEITAEDLTNQQAVVTVGRVILSGNGPAFGISQMGQSHEHLGCVPCDLFYESVISAGPYILQPPNAHAVKSGDGEPPQLTSDSC